MTPQFEDNSQSELFEVHKKTPIKRLRIKTQAFFSRPRPNITFSYENFIFLLISIIIFVIGSFSLGVERGRHIERRKERPLLPKIENKFKVLQEERANPIERSKPYTVQVGSFKKLEAAEKMAVQLRASGYEALVLQSGDYFRVCVGSFFERREADKLFISLKKKFSDCIITKR